MSKKDKWLTVESFRLYGKPDEPRSIHKIRKDKIVAFSLYSSGIYIWVQTSVERSCYSFDLPDKHSDGLDPCLSKAEFDKLYTYLLEESKPGGELNKLDSIIHGD